MHGGASRRWVAESDKERMGKQKGRRRTDRCTGRERERVRKFLGHGFESHPDLLAQVPWMLWMHEYHAE